MASQGDIATSAKGFAQSQIDERFNFLTLEKHFSHNLNAAWQKLDDYYNRTDATPIYRAAVFLHPRLKWRWFERHWASKPEWIAAARKAIEALWSEYKNQPTEDCDPNTNATAVPADEDDEWANDDDAAVTDQLWLYQQEPHSTMTVKDSPIKYWVSKRSIWPQLSKMALDVYSTPLMSDEPERVFSTTGNLMSPCRRRLLEDGVEKMVCLRSWDRSGIVKLDRSLFNIAIAATSIDGAEGEEMPVDPPLIQID